MKRIFVAAWNTTPLVQPETLILRANNWDDFGYKTLFKVSYVNANKEEIVLGDIKVGYEGQPEGWTRESLPPVSDALPPHYFSVGQDADYYKCIAREFSSEARKNVLSALGDIVLDPERSQKAAESSVFKTSLLRFVSLTTIKDQYRRILEDKAPLTPYDFSYKRESTTKYSGVDLRFKVQPQSLPPTNIHVLIGRNGVGKTTILNDMVSAATNPNQEGSGNSGKFVEHSEWGHTDLAPDASYFSGVVSVSFSAFDPFEPPSEQMDPEKGPCYSYIGLKSQAEQDHLSSTDASEMQETRPLRDSKQLRKDFLESLDACLSQSSKKTQWLKCIRALESDPNFAEMELQALANETASGDMNISRAWKLFRRLSSGHAVVLLTITRLVERVAEKTLVLIDEPESHLHPPLLAAFTRAVSELLSTRNAIAIIATHSPVVLQEVPKSCVWKLHRILMKLYTTRPEFETFGENVGALTRDVFGLEVEQSGFHRLLRLEVDSGLSYDQVLTNFGGQIGLEGKIILRELVHDREGKNAP